jgi:hypothetical protein
MEELELAQADDAVNFRIACPLMISARLGV